MNQAWRMFFASCTGAFVASLVALGVLRTRPAPPPTVCECGGLTGADRSLLMAAINAGAQGLRGTSANPAALPASSNPPSRPEAKADDASKRPSIDDESIVSAEQSARESGQRIVDDALAHGEWRREEITRLRPLLPRMSADDRRLLLRSVVQAINDKRLRLADAGPPF